MVHPEAFWRVLVHPAHLNVPWYILVHHGAFWCILVHPGVFLAVLLSSPGLCWAAVAGEEKLRLDGHSCPDGLGQARLGSCLGSLGVRS